MTVDQDKYYFDNQAADRVCRFFETLLVHWKGEYAGQRFKLLPWQRKILRDIFGWKRKSDDLRRYRTVYIEVPRKAGKSFFASGIGLYLLLADNEQGAEVYSAANNTQQASITFDNAKKIISASAELSKRLKICRWHIEHPKSNSVLRCLSGKPKGKMGFSVSGLIFDEMHEQPDRELWDALTSSQGARRQPLNIVITTAGYGGDETICRELHNTAVKTLKGESEDDTFYAAIFAAGAKDAWDDPKTWYKANPSLGVTVPEEFYHQECIKAKETPALENVFRRLYLNQWTEQQTRWLSLGLYDSCVAKFDEKQFDKQPCIVALDLSEIHDITALITIYPQADKWYVVPRLYMPEMQVDKRSKEDGIDYRQWVKDGHIIEIPKAEVIDHDFIVDEVMNLAVTNPIIEFGFDPYNANQITAKLDNAGITTVPVYQSYLAMSTACKEFERRLTTKQIVIQNNPCMRWMAGNVEVESDRHGNIRPVKPKAKGRYHGSNKYKVDGIVATIIGIARAMLRVSDDVEQNMDGLIAYV